MATKQIGKLEGKNLTGGGIKNLIQPIGVKERNLKERTKKRNNRTDEEKVLVKTFNINDKDYQVFIVNVKCLY